MKTTLKEGGYLVNHKKAWRFMKELSLLSIIRKKRKSSSYTPSIVYPNRLKRQFHAVGPAKAGHRHYLSLRRYTILLLVGHSGPI
ncbi:hypothetical protein [Paenibacillus sp. NPDC057934]|uniref:hypothetical protein n=1 Tax=Paenibacillus sp. NPDC057934 TaxID=3346282 RepID=UPI0036DBA8FA